MQVSYRQKWYLSVKDKEMLAKTGKLNLLGCTSQKKILCSLMNVFAYGNLKYTRL